MNDSQRLQMVQLFRQWNGYIDDQMPLDQLFPLIHRYYPDEYLWSWSFEPGFVRRLMAYGCLPMAERFIDEQRQEHNALTPKLHLKRHVMVPEELHIEKSARRRSKGAVLTVNRSFDRVLRGCLHTHGDGWLTPRLVGLFSYLQKSPGLVQVASVEVWREGRLTAGELGYFWGRGYTSLSGFTSQSGDGTVQLLSLGALLFSHGFGVWDLGMEVPYKLRLGAKSRTRDQFELLRAENCADGATRWPHELLDPEDFQDLCPWYTFEGREYDCHSLLLNR